MKKTCFAIAVIAGLAFCMPAPLSALAQGYKGLMADPETKNDGYGTIMPPSQKKNDQKEPSGYRGVIPGQVAPSTTVNEPLPDEDEPDAVKTPVVPPDARVAPQPRRPRVSTERQNERLTYVPGKGPRTPMLTADQLKLISTLSGMKFDLKQLPENMRESIKINPKVYSLVSSPATRIDGMLPTEYGMKKMIDTNLYLIDQSNFTPEKKKEAMIDLMIRLRQMADALRMRQSAPDELYAQMGVPAIYVQEEKEGTTKGIARLDQAIRYLYEEQKKL